MRVVSIHQPPYLPWFGLIDKIARSDVFVVLDNVQYSRRAFHHRTLYSTGQGGKYLSLSITTENAEEPARIMDARLADKSIPRKHFETLRHRYGRRPGWPALEVALAQILMAEHGSLLDLNLALLRLTLRAYDINADIVLASNLGATSRKGQLMLDLTRAAGGDVYLSGRGAEDYIEPAMFERTSVGLWWQAFSHPIYPQSHAGAFVPGCFALEWFLEEPDGAVAGFRAHLANTGEQPPRSTARVVADCPT